MHAHTHETRAGWRFDQSGPLSRVRSSLLQPRRFYSESDHNDGVILCCPDSVTTTHTVGGSFLPRRYRVASLDNDRER